MNLQLDYSLKYRNIVSQDVNSSRKICQRLRNSRLVVKLSKNFVVDMSTRNIEAFIDHGYQTGREFFTKFLQSVEFKVDTLRALCKSKSRQKDDLVSSIFSSLDSQELDSTSILLAFVKQPRVWMSFKQGKVLKFPRLESPEILLYEFGKDCWYGPIEDDLSNKKWYIRTFRIPNYAYIGIGEARNIDTRYVRWTVIAEIGGEISRDDQYISLSWNGFSNNEAGNGENTITSIESFKQFQYWIYIADLFEELKDKLQAEVDHPILGSLQK